MSKILATMSRPTDPPAAAEVVSFDDLKDMIEIKMGWMKPIRVNLDKFEMMQEQLKAVQKLKLLRHLKPLRYLEPLMYLEPLIYLEPMGHL